MNDNPPSTEVQSDESPIEIDTLEDVSDDTLEDAAFELRQRGSFIGWTDADREAEYLAIADHLLEQRSESTEADRDE